MNAVRNECWVKASMAGLLIKGGVLGGSLGCGEMRVGDELEIRPGTIKQRDPVQDADQDAGSIHVCGVTRVGLACDL